VCVCVVSFCSFKTIEDVRCGFTNWNVVYKIRIYAE